MNRKPYYTSVATTPAPAWLDRVLKSPPFLEAARGVAAIQNEAFDAGLRAVEGADGFLGWTRLRELVGEHVLNAEQTDHLASFLLNFAQLRRDVGLSQEDFVQTVRARLPQELTVEARDTIIERLPRVLAPKAGIERQTKANDVVRSLGTHLEESSFISDLRPIFDESRERVEGLVPITTLRLVTDGPNSPIVEVQLTEDDLVQLCAQAERAKRKLASLKRFVREKSGVALPDSQFTDPEESP
jgi:hypothetical protein